MVSLFLGVDLASGDLLFFADESAFYRPDHISKCYNSLVGGKRGMVRTGIIQATKTKQGEYLWHLFL